MKISQARIVEAVGVLAVVLSLLFVAYQIQQANRIARVTTEYEIRNNYSEFNESIYTNSNVASLIAKLRNTNDPITLTGEEQVAVFTLVLRAVNIWAAGEVAYDDGMLSERTFNFILDDIRTLLGSSVSLHPFFRLAFSSYPSLSGMRVTNLAIELMQ